jgi:hypothetical protein
MNAGEQALHTSTSRNVINQRLHEDQSTSSHIQNLRASRKARLQQGANSAVPDHIKEKNAIGKKEKDGFAILTRILKIK